MTTESQAISQNNSWSEVYDLAENYRNQQRWQSAIIAYQRAIALRPDFFWSYHHLGDTLSQLGLWSEAAKTYLGAVKLNPDFFWSWHNLGTALGKLQQWSKAVQTYTQAVKLDPNFFWSWHNLADAWASLGKWEQAIACYLQASQLEHQYLESQGLYQKLGTAFKRQGSLNQSIQFYRGLIRSSQQDSIFYKLRHQPQKLLELGENLAREHQIFGAIIVYYLLLEIQPEEIEILSRLNRLLDQQTQLEQKIAVQREKLTRQRATRAKPSELLTRQKPHGARGSSQGIKGRVIIENNALMEPQQLEDLFRAVDWSDRPQEKVKLALSRSYSYVCAWHIVDDIYHQNSNHQNKNHFKQLVGFARAVSDGVFQATLLDIVVHPNFQGRGIGKIAVERLVQQLHQAEVSDITLFASPHMMDFYHKLGFVAQPNGLQWMLWCPQN